MDIKERVREIRIARDKPQFVTHFSSNKQDLDALVQLTLNLEEYPYKEYSSWVLVHLCKSKTIDLQYLYPSFVDLIFKTEDQTVLRNVVNCLGQINITEYRESDLIDQLIKFIQDFDNKVALQVYSMFLLVQFVKKYPELKTEIIEIIEFNNRGKTAAYSSASRKFSRLTKNI